MTPSSIHLVVMGVAGCGKSEIGQRIAHALHLPLIEGDDFHPAENIEKMERGQALTDADRADWLSHLGHALARQTTGAVLTCSALKASYRNQLRALVPGLRFVHLVISPETSLRRVANRPGHFYPPSLVASQFEALQDPAGEPGVLALDATLAPQELERLTGDWLSQISL